MWGNSFFRISLVKNGSVTWRVSTTKKPWGVSSSLTWPVDRHSKPWRNGKPTWTTKCNYPMAILFRAFSWPIKWATISLSRDKTPDDRRCLVWFSERRSGEQYRADGHILSRERLYQMVRNIGEREHQYRSFGTISDQRGPFSSSLFVLSISSLQIMKHTEQLEQRPSPSPNSGGLNVGENTAGKAEGGRKCCGGSNDAGEKKSWLSSKRNKRDWLA